MAALFDVELVPAAVHSRTSFREAANELTSHPVSTIAVLDDEDQVIGLFGGERLLHGLFPLYLEELHHTAFATDDEAILDRCARERGDEPIEQHMKEPVTVDMETSATHVAELFLHHNYDALPVVEEGKFVGMLGRSEFCQAMFHRA